MEKTKCKFIKPNGTKCEAYSMANSDFCFFHNPAISENKKREIQSKGGKANKIKVLEVLPPITLKSSEDVILLLNETINKVRDGTMDLKVANCIGYLAGHLLRAIEITNLENRVEIIEKIVLEKSYKK